ncbi:MAG: MGMT family protein, partial [Desulfobacteraceae bacterium]|nr:MGMT family protein [Desulfobacteraceae bacterium]
AALLNNPEKKPLPLDFSCTPFRWSVLKAIATIPFGETRTYGEVASMVGKPGGARAVGQVMGKNPLPLIFP